MIRDLTESLEAVLKQPGLPAPLKDATIEFDRPTEPYTPQNPTINLFLFEIRENVELRLTEATVRPQGSRSIVERPARRVMCSYLVTAWPTGQDLSLQEHRLLSQFLQLFASMPTIPPVFLQGALVNQDPPVPVVIAQPDGLKNPAEFWAAIGNKLKASVILSVTIAMPIFKPEDLPTVVSSGIDLSGTLFRVAGVVTNAANAPVAGAGVRVVDRGRSTVTNTLGQFSLAAIPPGIYTLRITAGAVTTDKAIVVPAPAGSNYNVQLP
jgi:Pvc16 N-terminal domain/Carboxypeptidase regulatory-like domain